MASLETNLRAAPAPAARLVRGAPTEATPSAAAGPPIHEAPASSKAASGCGQTLLIHALLLVFAAAALLPFVWMICASFKTGEDLFAYTFLPWDGLERLTLDNYRKLFTRQPFRQWMLNSLFLSSAYTATVVTLSSLGGFALAKYRFAGKGPLMAVMLATMMLPPQVLVIANYELMYSIGWIDTYRAILVPTAVSVFGMFLFKQAMSAVPDELLAAGRVDGCSELRLWWEVALPVVRPMIGAFTLLSFLGAWKEFLWPSIVLQDEAKYTLPISLANMLALVEYRTEYGVLMAGTLLAVLPVMVLFFVLQKDFIAGLVSGAVKG